VDEDGRLTAMGGPGDHPGMARKAAAGPMDAGSLVVATTSTTIMLLLSSSASVAGVAAAPRPRPPHAASTCSAQYRRATTRNRSACLAGDARGSAEWLAAPWEAAGRERWRGVVAVSRIWGDGWGAAAAAEAEWDRARVSVRWPFIHINTNRWFRDERLGGNGL
jgi:hypothetical protein